jgi:hypothetical protein
MKLNKFFKQHKILKAYDKKTQLEYYVRNIVFENNDIKVFLVSTPPRQGDIKTAQVRKLEDIIFIT